MKFNWNAAVAVVQVMENDPSIPNIKGDGYEVTRTDSGYHIDLDRGEFEAEPTPATPETPVETPTVPEVPAETPSETPAETPAATGETAETPETPAEETSEDTGPTDTSGPVGTVTTGDEGPVSTQ